jgi:hypothetical protein
VYVLYLADLGTRLDSAAESALALYVKRELYVEYLAKHIAAASGERKLESALYTALSPARKSSQSFEPAPPSTSK